MKTHRIAQISLSAAFVAALLLTRQTPMSAQNPANRFVGPLSSQPLALTSDNQFLISANPDNDTVTFFDLRNDRNRKIAEVPVGDEPNGVAFSADGRRAYVANTISGTVSVLNINLANGAISRNAIQIGAGTEPYSLVMSPNGTKLYVANTRSNSISVINTSTNTVSKVITGVGLEPRGLAITNDDDEDDTDETLYVTNFLSLPVAGKLDGADDSKEGIVYTIESLNDTVVGSAIKVNPLADTGFKATGDALARIAPKDPADPNNFTFTTGAYPNQLNNVAIKGGYAFLPNTGASPNGPVRFNVNT
ncbi:MAG: beta-propeller fold lactonase family protein, partial [Bryobacteraceae bacterium]|nr:beta-propeller fold lactonase family protein [Bryobacteraceae bacterium]